MKNPNDMTLSECLAELFKGRFLEYDAIADEWRVNGPHGFRVRVNTLDEAARLLEGRLPKIEEIAAGCWVAKAFPLDGNPYSIEATGTTELLARFRLRVAVERTVAGS